MTTPQPQRFRKKPVTVEMLQWTGSNTEALAAFCGTTPWRDPVFVPTERGDGMAVLWNDQEYGYVPCPAGHYVVRGVFGEFYPISPAALAETYEPAEAVSDE
jgi:hypothetical protein